MKANAIIIIIIIRCTEETDARYNIAHAVLVVKKSHDRIILFFFFQLLLSPARVKPVVDVRVLERAHTNSLGNLGDDLQ